jgi:hypothetical protein
LKFFLAYNTITSYFKVNLTVPASCLSLLSNAVLLWNTHHIQRIAEELREQGMVIKDEHLAKISPLMFKHIQIHGTYHFDRIEGT